VSYSRVTLLPSGQILTVASEEAILEAALRAGINLPHSCKGGHCASCRARLVSGQVAYPHGRPPGLVEQEYAEGYALLCQARPASSELTLKLRSVSAALEIPVRSLPCRIERLQQLTDDVMAVFLRLPAAELFTFNAGQYVDIMLPQNRRRSFSLANPPHDAHLLELHVRRVTAGEFTEQLFAGTLAKALLRMEGPLGQFSFRSDSPRPALLIGGGTGYAPLRSMLRSLLEGGDRRPLHLYWGAVGATDLYEDAIIRSWCSQYPNLRYTPVLSAPPPQDGWHGRTGWVHRSVLEDQPELSGFDVYASGPPVMVEAIRREYPAHGLPPEQLFFDSFDFAPDVLSKLATAAASSAGPEVGS
jgi:CDP-4-dehydro-6-deoxyglucose reductase, E3